MSPLCRPRQDETIMPGEKFTLAWNDFGANCTKTFQQLWSDKDLTDVTLVTEDYVHKSAHRVILSSCSILFKQLFLQHPRDNTLVFLNGVKMRHLESILSYIYQGECEVEQDELAEFLATGKDLGVEGLSEDMTNVGDENMKEEFPQGTKPDDNLFTYQRNTEVNDKVSAEVERDIKAEDSQIVRVETKQGESNNMFDCEKSEYTTNYNINNEDSSIQSDFTYDCEKCVFKSTSHQRLKNHIETIHNGIIGIGLKTFDCDQCEYKSYRPNSNYLRKHKVSQHEGRTYDCDKCDYTNGDTSNLKRHKLVKHEFVQYQCNECEYTASYKSQIESHRETKHQGKVRASKFNCDQCDYQATTKISVVDHINVKHAGITYDCDQCGHKASRKETLQLHIQSLHEGLMHCCNLCDFKTSHTSSLYRHTRLKHGEQ